MRHQIKIYFVTISMVTRQWRGNYFRDRGGKTKGCNAKCGSSGNIFGHGGQDSRHQSLVSSRITVLRRNWIALS